MNDVQIVDNYYFRREGRNFVLYRTFVKNKIDFKTKKPTGDTCIARDCLGYYYNLTQCCQAAAKYAAADRAESSGITTLGEYIEIMKDIESTIEKLVGEE